MAVAEAGTSADATAEPRPARAAAASAAARMPYFPALDGLRGLAVAGVLCFHAEFPWMPGGFLGVSTFFTLSGFLITSLLLTERAARGRVDLKAFWVRRFRRLMPASLACLALVVLFGVFAAESLQRENLAGDVVSCLAYVANWRFIFSDQAYADLFAEPSPVLHFWSLAIEEQFYLLYPLLVGSIVGLAAWAPRARNPRRRRLLREAGRHYRLVVAIALLVLLAGSVAVTLFAGFDDNRIYLGTDTRAAELLLGGLLATILFKGALTRRMAQPGPFQVGVAIAGAAALLASVALWRYATDESAWLYVGGLAGYAVLSSLVICAAILPVGPVARGLALAPIRHLGKISYGVYLYHWPIFLWLRQKTDLEQGEWGDWRVFLVAVPITLVVAELSYRFLEMPIRRGERIFKVPSWRVAPVAIAGIAAAVVVVSITAPPPIVDFARADEDLQALYDAGPPPTVDPTSLEPPPPRVAVFGDSTALMSGWGLAGYLKDTGIGTNVQGATGLGCGIVRAPERRIAGDAHPNPVECYWPDTWPQPLADGQPNLVMVQSGNWDVGDVRLEPGGPWLSFGDPGYDEYLLGELTAAVDLLSSRGAIVVWLTSPLTGNTLQSEGNWNPRERLAHYNELVEQLPAVRPGKVVVVELDDWIASMHPAEDARLRPDGVHFTEETSYEVAERFLADAIVTAWRDQWIANRRAELEAGATVTVRTFGDDTALRIGDALTTETAGQPIEAATSAIEGCGVTRTGARRLAGPPEPLRDECNDWQNLIFMTLVGKPIDIAVVHTGVWDVADRQLPGDPPDLWRAPGDPYYDEYLLGEIGAYTDALHRSGAAQVVWLLAPHVKTGAAGPDEATRIDRLNELIIESAKTRNYVTVVDYAAFARSWPGGELSPAHRPDGIVPNHEAAAQIARWLAPRLVAIDRGAVPEGAIRPAG